MICTNCGAELKSGAKFCGQCGTAITSQEVDESTKANDESKPNIKNSFKINKFFLLYILAFNLYVFIKYSTQAFEIYTYESIWFGMGAMTPSTLILLGTMLIPKKRNRVLIMIFISCIFLVVMAGSGY